MKDKGNGRPEQCTANLLVITRGEVPYERIKGLDAGMIDRPSTIVSTEARADIEWALRIYEPRVNVDGINIEGILSGEGQFGLDVDVTAMRGGRHKL